MKLMYRWVDATYTSEGRTDQIFHRERQLNVQEINRIVQGLSCTHTRMKEHCKGCDCFECNDCGLQWED